MKRWEYGVVRSVQYREGGDPDPRPREIVYVTLPGADETTMDDPRGLLGVLNRLGDDGWELVDVEQGGFWLKRRATHHHHHDQDDHHHRQDHDQHHQ